LVTAAGGLQDEDGSSLVSMPNSSATIDALVCPSISELSDMDLSSSRITPEMLKITDDCYGF
jgi:hypothetical protein